MQIVLTIVAVVMIGAGAGTVVAGASSVPREGVVTPDVDTEMRFYAVWYVVMGIVVLRSVAIVEAATWTVRLLGAGFFFAGCGRILSWVAVGKPHVSQVALMVIELLLPALIIPWQAAVARREAGPQRHDKTLS